MRDGFVKVAVATPCTKVADPAFNSSKIIEISKKAAFDDVKIIVFPELSITSYTCSDLFQTSTLLDTAKKELKRIIDETSELDMLIAVGVPLMHGTKLYNCAAVLKSGRLLGIVPKANIPNYGEFYELRHFAPAPAENSSLKIFGEDVPFGKNIIFECESFGGIKIAAEICEDIWVGIPPSCYHTANGATVILNISASNEIVGKEERRKALISSHSARTACAYLYSSSGEGESTTDLVFSGHCLVYENGSLLAERKPFDTECEYVTTEIDTERLLHDRIKMNTYGTELGGEYTRVGFDLAEASVKLTRRINPHPFVPSDPRTRAKRCETILSIQAKGLARRIEAAYAKKCVIGISGGLDSCLALLVTARAMEMLKRPTSDIVAVTMPCFGTTKRTRSNAEILCTELGTDFRTVDIAEAVGVHFRDIGHDPKNLNVVYENVQARERTQVIMDIANAEGGMVVGTGDLSELALGWATYNGDHMSMYGVNASVPKTLIRHIVAFCADRYREEGKTKLSDALLDILDTPVSPELLPAKDGEISQKTEDLVGPYELHDFYIYNMLRFGFSPRKLLRLAEYALGDVYDESTRLKWLEIFIKRFFAQQFKRSCIPDGPKVGTASLSPRGDWRMPSDASCHAWLEELEELKR